jgi:hypothetical protein
MQKTVGIAAEQFGVQTPNFAADSVACKATSAPAFVEHSTSALQWVFEGNSNKTVDVP